MSFAGVHISHIVSRDQFWHHEHLRKCLFSHRLQMLVLPQGVIDARRNRSRSCSNVDHLCHRRSHCIGCDRSKWLEQILHLTTGLARKVVWVKVMAKANATKLKQVIHGQWLFKTRALGVCQVSQNPRQTGPKLFLMGSQHQVPMLNRKRMREERLHQEQERVTNNLLYRL